MLRRITEQQSARHRGVEAQFLVARYGSAEQSAEKFHDYSLDTNAILILLWQGY